MGKLEPNQDRKLGRAHCSHCHCTLPAYLKASKVIENKASLAFVENFLNNSHGKKCRFFKSKAITTEAFVPGVCMSAGRGKIVHCDCEYPETVQNNMHYSPCWHLDKAKSSTESHFFISYVIIFYKYGVRRRNKHTKYVHRFCRYWLDWLVSTFL